MIKKIALRAEKEAGIVSRLTFEVRLCTRREHPAASMPCCRDVIWPPRAGARRAARDHIPQATWRLSGAARTQTTAAVTQRTALSTATDAVLTAAQQMSQPGRGGVVAAFGGWSVARRRCIGGSAIIAPAASSQQYAFAAQRARLPHPAACARLLYMGLPVGHGAVLRSVPLRLLDPAAAPADPLVAGRPLPARAAHGSRPFSGAAGYATSRHCP